MKSLTPTEQKIADILCEKGSADKEIAEELGMHYRTVQTHMRNIYAKLGVKNRTELVIKLKEKQ